MNNGKQQLNNWRIVPLLGLICLFFYFVLPSPWAQSAFGCVTARVTIGGREWRDPATPNYTNPPPVEISCGSVEAFAGAGIDDPCGSVAGTPSITISGEGFKVITNATGTGWAKYLIKVVDPGAIGSTVTVIATVTGPVQTGTEPNGITPICTTKTFTATGVVVLKAGCGCGGDGEFGSGGGTNNSVDFRLNLGPASPSASAGFLWLKADAPSVALATPASLQLPYRWAAEEVVTNLTTGVIEQILVPQGLVHVKTVSAYEYQVQCFYRTNVTAKVGGYYGTNAPAFTTWVISNPDTNSAMNRLWITEQQGSNQRQQKYTYTASSLRWDLLQPDGHTLSTWKVPDGSDDDVTNYFREISVGGTSLNKIQEVREYVLAINRTLLKQMIEGGNGVTRTSTYAYYPSGVNVNELQRVDYPDGQWVYYVYDGSGRTVKEYSSYLNYAPPASGEPAVANGDRYKLTEYSYTINASANVYNNQMVRTTVSLPFLNGSNWEMKEVSRNYRLTSTSASELQQCVEPGADWDDPRNLKTLTTTYVASSYFGGRPSQTTRPDGTYVSYSYPDEFTTYETHSDGDFVEKVVDEWGKPLWETRTKNGVLVSSETYCYTNSAGEFYDNLRRTYDVTDLAGRKTHYNYGCCSLESVVDPDGVSTLYDYDSLKRLVASEVFYGSYGIKTTNVLDAVGQVLATKRIGTYGSSITLEQFQYDILGRTIRHTNALNGVTINLYAIVNNRLQEITLNPDGGTRTNTYFRDGNLETVTGTAVHGVKYVHGVEQDGSIWRQFTKEIKLNASYAETSEWTKTYVDGAGRAYKTVFSSSSGNPYQETYYNDYGQRSKSVDPDGVVTLYQYDAYGELQYTAVDLNQDDQIDFGGTDRIMQSETIAVATDGTKPDLIQRNRYVWKDGESTGTLVSRSETSTDGLRSWQMIYPDSGTTLTNRSSTLYLPASQLRVTTNTAPDNSYTVTTNRYGRLVSVTRFSAADASLGQTTYSYDPHGRQNAVTDARTGATTYEYNDADQVSSVTTPVPGLAQSAQRTVTYYNKFLQATNVLQPDGSSVFSEYHVNGMLKKTYGSRTYPVEYTYDYAGRMKTMKTWQDFNESTGSGTSGSAVTTWNYDVYRGWLTNKLYADSTGPIYSNTPAGRLAKRTWARTVSGSPLTTTYSYNNAGDLSGVDYSDSTADVTYGYDRRGRQNSITQAGGTATTLIHDDAGNLLSESYAGGPLNGLTVTNHYDSLLRRATNGLWNGSIWLTQSRYTYDNASRLTNVSDGTYHASYDYLANSPLVSTVYFKSNTTLRMTTTKSYDLINRLTAIASVPTADATVSYSYGYNAANQRTRNTTVDDSYWSYEYDALGQVKRGAKYFNDGYPVPGQQFEYGHDDIGNRTGTKAGGDENGVNLRSATYAVNSVNQYTNRTVPGGFDVVGLALGTNSTLTVNSSAPWRKGEYFRKELTVANTSAAVWTNVSVAATGETTVSGNVFVPQTPEVFYHDADGNLTNDGRWIYTWDAENRLVKQESLSSAPTGSKRRLEFVYDARSRRIEKLVSTNNGTYVAQYTNRFVYDGWNLVASLNPQSSILQSFMWGLDLSGSAQGAGGVGGLLVVNDTASVIHFAAYDGNGNVVALVKGTDGTVSAIYDYGPFGEAIRASGVLAKLNPFRFSTKYQDDESEYLYYGYRSYNPSSGRWLSRDPIAEQGGKNLYNFVYNNPLNYFDFLGLKCTEAVGKNGKPRIAYESAPPTGGWKVSKFNYTMHDDDDTYDGIAMMSGVKLTWSAAVIVLCKCDNGCYQIRKGTRISDATVKHEFLAQQPGGMPVDIPTPTTLIELIGEGIAAVLDSEFGKPLSMTNQDFSDLARKVRATKPKKPWDGKWEGGKSPCD